MIKLNMKRCAVALGLLLALAGMTPAGPAIAGGAAVAGSSASGGATKVVSAAKTGPGVSVQAPHDWHALTREGYRRLSAGNLEGAQTAFAQALKLHPWASSAKTGMGTVLFRKGEFKKAEQILKQAMLLNPNPARAHYELGRVYQQLGKFDQAVAQFKLGIEKFQERGK
jgi:Flp pilus assembly protein TadD